jgi:multimeric flavodoxin WrbA
LKILALSASPRIKGNSDLLLDAFLEGACGAGVSCEKIHLVKKDIRPCIGCEKCFEKGDCQFDDDAPKLYAPLLNADLVILATPIYFYSTSTWAKLLIDRCQALWARKHILKIHSYVDAGRGVLLATGASGGPSMFEGARLSAKYFFEALGKDLAGCLCVAGVDEKKAILSRPGVLEKARDLGRSFAGDNHFTYLEGCKNGNTKNRK